MYNIDLLSVDEDGGYSWKYRKIISIPTLLQAKKIAFELYINHNTVVDVMHKNANPDTDDYIFRLDNYLLFKVN